DGIEATHNVCFFIVRQDDNGDHFGSGRPLSACYIFNDSHPRFPRRQSKFSQFLLIRAAGRRRAPTRKPSASVRQYEAMKILLPRVRARDRPLLFDRNHSFRSVFSVRRQFLAESPQFVPPLRQRTLRADYTPVSPTPVTQPPKLQGPPLADLRSMTAERTRHRRDTPHLFLGQTKDPEI